MPYASVLRRLAAWALDLYLVAIMITGIVFIRVVTYKTIPLIYAITTIIIVKLLPLLLLLYHVYFLRRGGTTLGGKVMGTQVVTTSSTPPTMVQIVARELVRALSMSLMGIGHLPIFFSIKKQTVYDRIAGTVVVHEQRGKATYHLWQHILLGVTILLIFTVLGVGLAIGSFAEDYYARQDPCVDQKVYKSIPDALAHRDTACYVVLDDQGLTELPAGLEQLPKLRKLSLVRNNFTEFPKEILKLTQLTELRLGYNHISTLPPEIQELSHLRILDLNRNELTSLPLEFANLSSLRYAGLNRNQFVTELEAIRILENKRTVPIDLSGNPFTPSPSP